MIVSQSRRAVALFVCAGVFVLAAWGAQSASAAEPWWHLVGATRSTSIQPGTASNEVQEIVGPGEDAFQLEVGGQEIGLFETYPYVFGGAFPQATAENVQTGLEAVYGSGNVLVTGGPVGLAPLIVTSVKADAGAPVAPIKVELSGEVNGQLVQASVKTPGSSDGQIVLTAANLGDASINGGESPVSVLAKLPAGLRAVSIEGFSGQKGSRFDGPVSCTLATLECTYAGSLPPYNQLEVVVGVDVEGAQSGAQAEYNVSGGGAPVASLKRAVSVGQNNAFGVEDYELTPEEEGGATDVQAGSHPFQLTTILSLNNTLEAEPGLAKEPIPTALDKDLRFKLPPGLIGNPTPFPRCTDGQFLAGGAYEPFNEDQCPVQTAIGIARVTVYIPKFSGAGIENFTVPLFNLDPSVGEPARFGFYVAHVPVYLNASVRTGEDYGVTVTVPNITQEAAFLKSEVTFWGVPGDPRHDNVRGYGCLGVADKLATHPPCAAQATINPPPLLVLPTSCTGQLHSTVEADPWTKSGEYSSLAASGLPALDGCNRLPFNSSIAVAPDGQAGSTATGLTVGVHVPQDLVLNPTGLAESNVRDTTVALPAGIGINPASADGLQACSEAQIALSSPGQSACPDASKVATVRIKTPLLPNALEGAAYLAQQDTNPFGSLVALYVFVEDPISGSRVKLAGEVKPDPVTGQLVSTFKNTPQLPFEDFELHFFGGARAPLSTPALCGSYTTTASISPWSGNLPAQASSNFTIASGPNGSPCSNPLPFSPALTAGTTSIQAGGFSPFTMTMSRPDGSQNLQAIKLTMPPGLLGTLASVKLCKETQANAGTCGPESLIGHTTVSVGVGGDPYTVTGGEVFITEGYEGAPYGLSIVNPAKAGPFDLGKVIVRAKIQVDPLIAALTITTDNSGPYKIPTILDGIPLQIQHVEVSIDRPNFTFNPTNCSPLQVGGSLYSNEGSSAAVKVPFQITNCAVLAFKPKLTAKTAGKTSRKTGASLTVKLTYPAGPYDANIAKVKVDLPKQLPSKLPTLQHACPAATFEANPAACPAASIVGHATASTPVLPVPLTGPAYFVSHGGEAFPDLIIVLQGYGATVHLVGSTYINPKTNITSSTFKAIPDVPVGTFELTLPQGQYSALAATANLCTTKLAMPTSFIAQNGAEIHTSTPITPTGCAKKKAGKTNKKHKKTSHKGTTHKQKK